MREYHSDVARASWTVKTEYGTFQICDECRRGGHCPPAAGRAYTRRPNDPEIDSEQGCQCEHASHDSGPAVKS